MSLFPFPKVSCLLRQPVQRVDIELVDVAQTVARPVRSLAGGKVSGPADAGEEEVLAVGRQRRPDLQTGAVDGRAEVLRRRPPAVLLVADVKVAAATAVRPAEGHEDE